MGAESEDSGSDAEDMVPDDSPVAALDAVALEAPASLAGAGALLDWLGVAGELEAPASELVGSPVLVPPSSV